MIKPFLIFFLVFFVSLPLFAQSLSVDTAWVRRYNGLADSTDSATAIVVDDSGYVYVTGTSYDSITGYDYDYVTIKYYPTGDTCWHRRYNVPGNGPDVALDIVLDVNSNIYVTGYSWGGATSYDYATIKFYPNGDTAWIRRYNGPANYEDQALAIAVDGSGNVYVTGTSADSTWQDCTTIKYYPDGDTAWVGRFQGVLWSVGMDIAIDSSGNTYVTGYGVTSYPSPYYLTIKYDPYGKQVWAKGYVGGAYPSYDVANAIAVKDSDNVYVTGGSNGDYATIKYDHNGKELWVRRYNGPGGGVDDARTIGLDVFGNIYVSGNSKGIGTGYDYATIKYYPNGDTAWVRRYNGPGNSNDYVSAIALDCSGNVYVTGKSFGSATGYDYATVKYFPNGDTSWIERYNEPGSGNDEASAIVVDESGNVYVTGKSFGTATDYDYLTIKYIQFLRGDANKDGKVTISDVVYLLNYLFNFGPAPKPILQAGDANCDGKVTISDAVYLINYLFKEGPAPCV